jgi:hypothetical protein
MHFVLGRSRRERGGEDRQGGAKKRRRTEQPQATALGYTALIA